MNKSRFLISLILSYTILSTGCSTTDKPLQERLYYLDGAIDNLQVWRMEKDGVTREQVTDEPLSVDNFMVSSKGDFAVISDNQLILLDRNGRDRRMIADGDLVIASGEEAYFNATVEFPFFSPDGNSIAYALDGVHLYDLGTGKDKKA